MWAQDVASIAGYHAGASASAGALAPLAQLMQSLPGMLGGMGGMGAGGGGAPMAGAVLVPCHPGQRELPRQSEARQRQAREVGALRHRRPRRALRHLRRQQPRRQHPPTRQPRRLRPPRSCRTRANYGADRSTRRTRDFRVTARRDDGHDDGLAGSERNGRWIRRPGRLGRHRRHHPRRSRSKRPHGIAVATPPAEPVNRQRQSPSRRPRWLRLRRRRCKPPSRRRKRSRGQGERTGRRTHA